MVGTMGPQVCRSRPASSVSQYLVGTMQGELRETLNTFNAHGHLRVLVLEVLSLLLSGSMTQAWGPVHSFRGLFLGVLRDVHDAWVLLRAGNETQIKTFGVQVLCPNQVHPDIRPCHTLRRAVTILFNMLIGASGTGTHLESPCPHCDSQP